MDDIALLRELGPAMGDTVLFKPAVAYRLPRSGYTDTPVPPDEPMADNPPTGAILDYYLSRTASGPVTIEISDAKGKLVRTYSSADPPELTDDELAKQMIPAYWVRPRRPLATDAGMHRWIWDLRGPQPLATGYDYPINAAPHATPRTPEGPRVAPGTYTVKLVANGKTATGTVEVKLDPRIKLPAAVVQQQAELERHLAELVARSSELVLQGRSITEQLAALAKQPAATKVGAQTYALTVKLLAILSGPKDAPPGGAPTLGSVNGKLSGLYRMIEVDAAPTRVQLAEAKQAESELALLAKSWDVIKATELTQANAAIKAAGLTELRPELRPQNRQGTGDEE